MAKQHMIDISVSTEEVEKKITDWMKNHWSVYASGLDKNNRVKRLEINCLGSLRVVRNDHEPLLETTNIEDAIICYNNEIIPLHCL